MFNCTAVSIINYECNWSPRFKFIKENCFEVSLHKICSINLRFIVLSILNSQINHLLFYNDNLCCYSRHHSRVSHSTRWRAQNESIRRSKSDSWCPHSWHAAGFSEVNVYIFVCLLTFASSAVMSVTHSINLFKWYHISKWLRACVYLSRSVFFFLFFFCYLETCSRPILFRLQCSSIGRILSHQQM